MLFEMNKYGLQRWRHGDIVQENHCDNETRSRLAVLD